VVIMRVGPSWYDRLSDKEKAEWSQSRIDQYRRLSPEEKEEMRQRTITATNRALETRRYAENLRKRLAKYRPKKKEKEESGGDLLVI